MTTISRSSTPPSIFTLTSIPSISRFPCLHVRMLHEQCGHISTLTIHESPCHRPYFGWVLTHLYSSASPTAPPRVDCEGMQTHVAIKRNKCKDCKVVVEPKEMGFFRWGKEIEKDKGCKKEEDRSLPVNEVVKRRVEWKREIEVRETMREEKRLGEREGGDEKWWLQAFK